MFGLMRNRNFRASAETQATDYRMMYCGTCKSMGAMYGQRSRMLLNFDVVFLAELLTVISEEKTDNWHAQYQSLNCFHLPQNEQDIPLPLKYAAAVNVLLAEVKTDDNIKDSRFFTWKLFRNVLSKSFQKAQATLKEFGMNAQDFWEEIAAQARLEQGKKVQNFMEYATPTARLTAMIFAKGAEIVGKPEKTTEMYALGEKFGQLVYLLDAYKDYEQDAKKGEFNALRVTVAPKNLSFEVKNAVLQQLYQLECEMGQALKTLNLPEMVTRQFFHRLEMNLAGQLSDTPETRPFADYQSFQSIATLYRKRWQEAKQFASVQTETFSHVRWALNYNLLLAAAFVAPKLPQHFPQNQPTEKSQWTIWAVMLATLAALGLGRKAAKSCKTMPRNAKFAALPTDCCSDCVSSCASECCESCIQSMCNACCDSCCDSLCDSMCAGSDARNVLGLVVLGLLLIAVIVGIVLVAI